MNTKIKKIDKEKREYFRQYYREHRNTILNRADQYYWDNREEILKQCKETKKAEQAKCKKVLRKKQQKLTESLNCTFEELHDRKHLTELQKNILLWMWEHKSNYCVSTSHNSWSTIYFCELQDRKRTNVYDDTGKQILYLNKLKSDVAPNLDRRTFLDNLIALRVKLYLKPSYCVPRFSHTGLDLTMELKKNESK